MAKRFEHKQERLAPKTIYYQRLGYSILLAGIILTISLTVGVLGYKWTVPSFDWYDSLLNASMILSGMGPVLDAGTVLSKSAKLFASFYALFSGITFLSTFGVLIAPVVHRFLHRLHLDESE